MSPLITVKTLASWLGENALCILDATALLPGETSNPDEAFLKAHIPGSLRFDIDLFSDPESTQPHTVPSAARLALWASAAQHVWSFMIRATLPRPAGAGGWPDCLGMIRFLCWMAAFLPGNATISRLSKALRLRQRSSLTHAIPVLRG